MRGYRGAHVARLRLPSPRDWRAREAGSALSGPIDQSALPEAGLSVEGGGVDAVRGSGTGWVSLARPESAPLRRLAARAAPAAPAPRSPSSAGLRPRSARAPLLPPRRPPTTGIELPFPLARDPPPESAPRTNPMSFSARPCSGCRRLPGSPPRVDAGALRMKRRPGGACRWTLRLCGVARRC